MAEVADILDRAASLIEPEGAWIKKWFSGTNDHGQPCWCVLGALEKAAEDYRSEGSYTDAKAALLSVIKVSEPWRALVTAWNDDEDRTQAEVVAALRSAASQARGGKGS